MCSFLLSLPHPTITPITHPGNVDVSASLLCTNTIAAVVVVNGVGAKVGASVGAAVRVKLLPVVLSHHRKSYSRTAYTDCLMKIMPNVE